MKLPNLVLLKHAIRLDNMAWQTYLVRLLMLVIITFSMAQVQVSSSFGVGMRAPGLMFFQIVTSINIFFVTAFAIGFFSTAITEEKESESLALLMMTGITPLGMLLSKGASKLMSGLMLMMAQFPFTVLSVTLGGVSMKQIFAVYVITIAYMFFLCNIALFFSVISRRSSQAGSYTLLTIIIFFVMCGNIGQLKFINPFVKVFEVLSTGFNGYVFDYCSLMSILMGLAFFGLSLASFNSFSREKGEGVPVFQKMKRSKKNILRLFRIERVWKEALSWKEFHFIGGGWSIFVLSYLLVVLCIFIIYLAARQDIDNFWESFPFMIFFIALAFLLIKLVYLASRMFGNEIWDKTLNEIIILPVSLRSIIWQKAKGGMLMLIPSLTYLVIGLILILFSGKIPLNQNSFTIGSYVALYAVKFVFFLYVVVYMSISVRYGVILISMLVYGAMSFVLSIPSIIILLLGTTFSLYSWGSESLVFSSLLSAGIYIFAICFMHRMTRKKLLSVIESS